MKSGAPIGDLSGGGHRAAPLSIGGSRTDALHRKLRFGEPRIESGKLRMRLSHGCKLTLGLFEIAIGDERLSGAQAELIVMSWRGFSEFAKHLKRCIHLPSPQIRLSQPETISEQVLNAFEPFSLIATGVGEKRPSSLVVPL